MDLENTSAVPVKAAICAPPDGRRTAIFTAKATFMFEPVGRVQLDREQPFDVIDDDEQTDLGLLPRDSLPRVDDAFEVILLGKAYAPAGAPVAQMLATLGVGAERRQVAVFGDRVWQGIGPNARISAARPFSTMPLTWQHAFGGKQEVMIDVDSPIDVSEPVNPDGKGFDHFKEAAQTASVFRPPEPYPQYSAIRELPNLEDPAALIRQWDDRPFPACWAPTPLHSAIVVERLRRAGRAKPDRPVTIGSPEIMHRAHPDWVIAAPPEGAAVEMDGVLPAGRASFALPSLRVAIDLRIGDREETVALLPRTLVLLPEQQRFYIVYRHFMTFEYSADETRAARVRLEHGPPAA